MIQKTILSLMLAALTMGAAAQTTESKPVENDTVQVIPDGMVNPEFPGGQKALMKFLHKNIRYPEAAAEYDIEGTATMTFIINEDGSISDISAHDCKIVRFNTTRFSQETEAKQKELKQQFAMQFAKEGARVIRKMPKWTPGKLNGKAVRVKHSLRVIFADLNK